MNMLNAQAPITIFHDEIKKTKIWEIIVIVLHYMKIIIILPKKLISEKHVPTTTIG